MYSRSLGGKRPGKALIRATLFLAIGIASGTPVAGTVTFRTVALSGDPAPGTGEGVAFSHFNSVNPIIDGTGGAAFQGILTGPGVDSSNNRGLWSEGSGNLALVARQGSPAPGTGPGVEFNGFKDPLQSNTGAIGFCGFLRGTGVVMGTNHIGIWSESSGTLGLVARLGAPAPGAGLGVNFSVFNTPTFSNAAQNAFFSLLTGPGVDGTNYRSIWSEGSGALNTIAQMGSPAPGTPAGVVFENFGLPVISGAGKSAFRATVSGPGVDATNSFGFWSEGSGTLELVARAGSPAPGTGPGVVFSDLNNITPAINDLGQTAFVAAIAGPGVNADNNRGVWSQGAGSLELIAREGSPALGAGPGVVFSEVLVMEIPGFPGDPFLLPAFIAQVINGAGKTAFVGSLSGPGVDDTNNIGVWSEGGGTLELVARTGAQAPGTEPGTEFAFFGYIANDALAFNSGGQLAFFGVLTGTGVDTANNRGIWAQDAAGDLTLVIRSGDTFEVAPGDLREVSGLSFITGSGGQDGRPRGFNDARQLVFGAQFADGSSGVFVASLFNACSAPCGDIDQSGGPIDLQDFATFASCFGGSPSASEACGCSDLNGDGSINLSDFATFSVMYGSQSTDTVPNCY